MVRIRYKKRIRYNKRPVDTRSDREKVTDFIAYARLGIEKMLQREDLRECIREHYASHLAQAIEFQEQLNEGKEFWKDLPEIQRANLIKILGLKGE